MEEEAKSSRREKSLGQLSDRIEEALERKTGQHEYMKQAETKKPQESDRCTPLNDPKTL